MHVFAVLWNAWENGCSACSVSVFIKWFYFHMRKTGDIYQKTDRLEWSGDDWILKNSLGPKVRGWGCRATVLLQSDYSIRWPFWAPARYQEGCCSWGLKPDNPHGWERSVQALLFFVSHQRLVSSIPLSVSKLQGQHFGGPSFAFPFWDTSGQFWKQLSCAWKMSSAFRNHTFLLMPGATSMTDQGRRGRGRSLDGTSRMIHRSTLSRPLRGKRCLVTCWGGNRKSLKPGIPNPALWTGSSPWPVRN